MHTPHPENTPTRTRRWAATGLLATLLFSTLTPVTATTPTEDPLTAAATQDLVKDTDRLIVTFDENLPLEDRQSVIDRAIENTPVVDEAAVIKNSVGEDTTSGVIKTDTALTDADQDQAIAALEADPAVVAVEPDYLVKAIQSAATVAPSEPLYGTLWNFRVSNVAPAWSTADGSGTTIAIVDTGITSHPDLDGNVVPGYDFISTDEYARDGGGRDPNPTDIGTFSGETPSNWHGTHVAGIAAAAAQGTGLAGVAPRAKIQPVRVLGVNGWGYASDIADGIVWASGGTVPGVPKNPNPATVVNASLAWPETTCPSAMDAAVKGAYSRGVPVVVASGNAGQNANWWTPANCYFAIVVGSTNSANTITRYSNWGEMLDVVAPGGTLYEQVNSTSNAGRTTATTPTFSGLYGTSQAAPMVAGTIALMKQVHPGMTIEQIRNTLKSTGSDASGYRQLNTGAAVAAAKRLAPAPPSPKPTPTPTPIPAPQPSPTPTPAPAPGYRVFGGIGAYYHANGGASVFGEPTQNEFSSQGGAIQNFNKGYALYWTERYGTFHMKWGTGIATFYRENRWELGRLGYPISNEYRYSYGAAQNFWRPSTGMRHTVLWSAETGSHSMITGGGIASKWNVAGGPGSLGFPTTEEQALAGGGVVQFFKRGAGETAIYWHPTYGTYTVNARGAFYHYWRANGYTSGLGYPVHDERRESDGKVHLRFSSGAHLTWSESEGTRRVR